MVVLMTVKEVNVKVLDSVDVVVVVGAEVEDCSTDKIDDR